MLSGFWRKPSEVDNLHKDDDDDDGDGGENDDDNNMFTPSQILCCLDDLMVEGYFLVLFVFVSCFLGGYLQSPRKIVSTRTGLCLFMATTAVPVCATDGQTVRHHCIFHFELPG